MDCLTVTYSLVRSRSKNDLHFFGILGLPSLSVKARDQYPQVHLSLHQVHLDKMYCRLVDEITPLIAPEEHVKRCVLHVYAVTARRLRCPMAQVSGSGKQKRQCCAFCNAVSAW